MMQKLLNEAASRGWERPETEGDTATWCCENGDTGVKHAIEVRSTKKGFRVSGRANDYRTAAEACDAIRDELNRHFEPGLLRQFGLRREFSAYGSPLLPLDRRLTHNDYGDILRQQGIW